MEKRKQFGEGTLFVLTNYIYSLLMTNIYFVLCNLIFLFFVISLHHSFSNITLYFVALIPTGPAISALYYAIGKLVREKEISPLKDFFYGYKLNFKDTMKFWLPLLLIFLILFVDLQYFNSRNSLFDHILSIVFIIGIILLIMISLNSFSINSRFNFRTKDLFKLSVYYLLKKAKTTFGNLAILIITLFITSLTTNFLFLFCASLICYLFSLNDRGFLEEVEDNFTKKS